MHRRFNSFVGERVRPPSSEFSRERELSLIQRSIQHQTCLTSGGTPNKAGRDHEDLLVAHLPSEGNDVLLAWTPDSDRDVRTLREERRIHISRLQRSVKNPEFDSSVGPLARELMSKLCCAQRRVDQVVQLLFISSVVDRSAIVRIDQAEIPQLGSSIDIGYARGGQLQHQLAERVDGARWRDAALERLEVFNKG